MNCIVHFDPNVVACAVVAGLREIYVLVGRLKSFELILEDIATCRNQSDTIITFDMLRGCRTCVWLESNQISSHMFVLS